MFILNYSFYEKDFCSISFDALVLRHVVHKTTPDNFADLYNANVKAEMVKLDETFKAIYGTQKEANGQLSGSVFMQDVLTSNTLEFSSNFTALAGGSQMSQVTFESPKVKVETTAS